MVSRRNPSAPQEVSGINVRRLSVSEYQRDDGQADHHLGGGHDQDEEDQYLPVHVSVHPRESHERKVDCVEHQLDEHEDDDRVAAHQGAHDANGEHQSCEGEVIDRIDAHAGTSSSGSARRSADMDPMRLARTITPTMATTRRIEVASKGST